VYDHVVVAISISFPDEFLVKLSGHWSDTVVGLYRPTSVSVCNHD